MATIGNVIAAGCRRSRLGAGIALAIALNNAAAMTITVNDAGDSGSPTGCTLRHAVDAINAGAFSSDPCSSAGDGSAFGTNDTILFDAALAGTTVFVSNGGPLTLTAPMQITGNGQRISAGAQNTIIDSRSNSTISGVKLTDGRNTTQSGGAIQVNGGTLNLNDSVVSESYNDNQYGGTIHVSTGHTLNLTNTTVTNNTTVGYSAAAPIEVFHGTVTLTNSTISNNTTNSPRTAGGAVYIRGGTLRVLGSTISGNTVEKFHVRFQGYVTGGVYSYNSQTSIINSTISGNHANCGGAGAASGAIAEAHDSTGGFYTNAGMILTNTTISGNIGSTTSSGTPYYYTAANVTGGVMLARQKMAKLTVANTIISGNTGSGIASPKTDFVVLGSSTISIVNSLLGSELDVSPHNDVGNANFFSDSPGLGALTDNGGATRTMSLAEGSLASDHGSNALAVDASSNPLTFDQAGNARIINGVVDIGAYEGVGSVIFKDGFDF